MGFYNSEAQSRRDRILHAALRLFHQKGYFNTSVHEIREKAGVSIGLVYRYFANKEKIAEAVYSELLQDSIANLEQISTENETVHDQCRAIMAYYLELTESFPEIVDFILFARHREILPNGQPMCARRAREIIGKIVAKGMEEGAIRPMHLQVAMVSLFGGTIRLMHLRILGVIQEPLPYFLDELWATAWGAVAAE
jgi:AcrR family transcriptional regulator